MQAIRTYPTRVEADLDRIALEAEGIACVVVGVGTAWEGGIEGVKLLVPQDQVERSLEILAGAHPSADDGHSSRDEDG